MGHNSKAKAQVTGKRAVLEEIGNKVTRGSNVPKVKYTRNLSVGKGCLTSSVLIAVVFTAENGLHQTISKGYKGTWQDDKYSCTT